MGNPFKKENLELAGTIFSVVNGAWEFIRNVMRAATSTQTTPQNVEAKHEESSYTLSSPRQVYTGLGGWRGTVEAERKLEDDEFKKNSNFCSRLLGYHVTSEVREKRRIEDQDFREAKKVAEDLVQKYTARQQP